MKIFAVVIASALLGGCSTSQHVTLAQLKSTNALATAALAPQASNSAEMGANVRAGLLAQGITPKPPLPVGTQTAAGVDAIVTYDDVWRWDLVMYLKTVSINLFDAASGNLLVTGRWDNSPFHGFQDSKVVVDGLISEMVTKLRASQPTATPEQPAANEAKASDL